MILLAIILAAQAAPSQNGMSPLEGPASCVAALAFTDIPREPVVDEAWINIMTHVEPNTALHQPEIDRARHRLETMVSDLDGRTNGLGSFSARQQAESCRDMIMQRLRERSPSQRNTPGARQ